MDKFRHRKLIIIVVPDIPPSLNKIFGMHWAARQREKQYWSELLLCRILIQKIKPVRGQVRIKLVYYFKTQGVHDYDNYSGKFILDGLKGRVIEDDNQRIVTELTHEFRCDPANPRLEIFIEPLRD